MEYEVDGEIAKIIKALGLQKLWDRDFIKEDYCSSIKVKINENKESRPLFNWAYYLMTEKCIFPLHKLLSDESWQYCLGGSIDLFLVKEGEIKTIRIGPNIFQGENLFYVVEKNTWFAAGLAPQSKFSLVTHCVSPGWDPQDDIPGYYEEMIKLLPEELDFVKKYSWPNTRSAYVMHESYKK